MSAPRSRFARWYGVMMGAGLALPAMLFFLHGGDPRPYIREVEKRTPADFPAFDGRRTGREWFAQLDRAVTDAFPFRDRIISTKRELERRFGGRTAFGDVTLGRDDWMFYHPDSGASLGGHDGAAAIAARLHWIVAQAAEHRTRFVFVMAPPKQVIYPEMCGLVDEYTMRQFAADRARVRAALNQFPADQVVCLREALLAAKSASPELLYFPTDTHHSHRGAMIMGRAIIDALEPGLWNPTDVVSVPAPSDPGDLYALAGFTGPGRTWPILVEHVERPGVHVVERRELGPAETPDSSIRYWMQAEAHVRLWPGRTVVLSDSYIDGFLRPSLAQFFEKVTFVHYFEITPERFRKILADSDTVVFECVERAMYANLKKLVPHPERKRRLVDPSS